MRNARRGGITVPVLFVTIGIIAFLAAITNYQRINLSVLRLETVVDRACDAVLMDYDDKLYDKYRLFGFKKLDNSFVENIIATSLSPEGSSHDFYHIEFKSCKSSAICDYSDISSFRQMVLLGNSNEFMVDSAVKLTKKLKLFKSLKTAKSMSDEYAKANKLMSKLQLKYSHIQDDIKKCSDLYNDIADLDYIDIAFEIRTINQICASGGKLDEGLITRRSELYGYVSSLNSYVGKANGVSASLQSFSLDISGSEQKLNEIISRIQSLANSATSDNAEYKELMENICEKINKNIEGLAESNRVIETQIEEAGNISRALNELVQGIDKIIGTPANTECNITISNGIAKSFETVDIGSCAVFNKSSVASNINAKGFFRAANKIMNGSLFPKYKFFDTEIDEATFNSLPSNKLKGNIIETVDTPIDTKDANDELLKEVALYEADGSAVDNDLDREHLSNKSKESQISDDIMKNNENYSKASGGGIVGDSKDFLEKLVLCDFVTRYFSCNIFIGGTSDKKISEISKNPLYKSEIEYVINGDRQSKKNVRAVDIKLFGTRLSFNTISLLLSKSDELNNLAMSLSSSLPVGYPVVYAVLLSGWSGLESLIDLKELHKGREILCIKFNKDFYIEISEESVDKLIKAISDNALDTLYQPKSDETDKENADAANSKDANMKSGIKFSYKDHLLLLLMFEDEKKIIARTLDLLQIDGRNGEEDYDILKYSTYLSVDAEISIPMLFGVKGLNHDIKIKRSRGY